jgi:transcriptional regulator with XRE-family HTH domain
MKKNTKNFLKLVSDQKPETLNRALERKKNRARLRESQIIALKILNKLDEPGWSQKKLAAEMGVSPQQVNKIVSGKENLTLETQIKLQEILDIPILASYYENNYKKLNDVIISIEDKQELSVVNEDPIDYQHTQPLTFSRARRKFMPNIYKEKEYDKTK